MRGLINGQSIRIDNHNRGSGEEFTWDNVHIHKVMNNDTYNGAEVLIPLSKNQDLEFRKIKGKSDKIKKQIKNEIKNALKNKTKRKSFVEDILNRIKSYSQYNTKSDMIQHLIDCANSIASHFDLSNSISESIKSEVVDKIKEYVTEHSDENGEIYYIIQDIDNKQILIGNNLDILDDWNDIERIFNQD